MATRENSSLACSQLYEEFVYEPDQIFCNTTWDGYLCWPPTQAGENSTQRCPSVIGFDSTKYAYRICRYDGRWEGAYPNDTTRPKGYTHFEICLNPVLRNLYYLLRRDGRQDVVQSKMAIAKNTRVLEFVGFSISLVSLLISLYIFCRYRSLRNNRTRIHKNLFVAMLIQVLIRLILYIDQAVVKHLSNSPGIHNTRYVCEGFYTLLEYARTAMFMWMFIEGLYLHNMLTVTVFQENSYYLLYAFIGWGFPVLMTFAWVVTMAIHFPFQCWMSYNLTAYFWILEGPRLGVLVLNILFLFNIIRILIVKLKQTHTSELEQVRTAVRATLFLLPLMGITNIIGMTDSHVGGEVWQFALWSYITHFVTSFQGFFVALLYCFINGEVRVAVKNSVMNDMSIRYRSCQPGMAVRRKSLSGVTLETEA
ncbi:Pigment-dispersing factor receptor [Carabus blaptoides fortunei]